MANKILIIAIAVLIVIGIFGLVFAFGEINKEKETKTPSLKIELDKDVAVYVDDKIKQSGKNESDYYSEKLKNILTEEYHTEVKNKVLNHLTTIDTDIIKMQGASTCANLDITYLNDQLNQTIIDEAQYNKELMNSILMYVDGLDNDGLKVMEVCLKS